MKAAVYKGNRNFAIQELPVRQINDTQVLVKVKYCAICGTDVHTVMYDVLLPDSIIGHEYCGVRVEVGSEVTQWKIGDRVIGGGGASPVGIPYGITADRINDGSSVLGQGEKQALNLSGDLEYEYRYLDAPSSFYASGDPKQQALADAIANKFYVIKPKSLPMPVLSYRNVGNMLAEQRTQVLGWMASHAGDAEALARYQIQLDEIDEAAALA